MAAISNGAAASAAASAATVAAASAATGAAASAATGLQGSYATLTGAISAGNYTAGIATFATAHPYVAAAIAAGTAVVGAVTYAFGRCICKRISATTATEKKTAAAAKEATPTNSQPGSPALSRKGSENALDALDTPVRTPVVLTPRTGAADGLEAVAGRADAVGAGTLAMPPSQGASPAVSPTVSPAASPRANGAAMAAAGNGVDSKKAEDSGTVQEGGLHYKWNHRGSHSVTTIDAASFAAYLGKAELKESRSAATALSVTVSAYDVGFSQSLAASLRVAYPKLKTLVMHVPPGFDQTWANGNLSGIQVSYKVLGGKKDN